MTAGLFDFLNAINNDKIDLLSDEENVKAYPVFMVLRGLSYFPDTVLQANEMNGKPDLSKKMVNDFLIHSIKKKKRFSKWSKKSDSTDDLQLLQDYYNINIKKAESALKILTEAQLQEIKQRMSTGGRHK